MDCGSREPSPGNQEITFPSLRVHVLACCLCVFVHVSVCGCFGLRLRKMFFFSMTKLHTPTVVHCSDLRNDKWNQHHEHLARLMPLTPALSPFKMLSVSAGRVSLVRITALRLEGLQLDDQGAYECRILLLDELTDELKNGTWTLLSVTGEAYGTLFVCLFFFGFMPVWLRVDYIWLYKSKSVIQM